MPKTNLAMSGLAVLLLSSPAYADLQVQFIEGAPKDRFVIMNVGSCDLGPAEFTIDFAASNSGLIFDVTDTGAGVEVFQSFEVTDGAQYLAEVPVISDGDQRATLSMTGIAQNEMIAFTIDVDDTNGTREITVTDDEISGTTFSLMSDSATYSVVMGDGAQAIIRTATCST
ncbi:MAG: hypothetical protein ACI9PU_001764 [Ascidiaceihabitans sp.]|jgi:hypothetical protein